MPASYQTGQNPDLGLLLLLLYVLPRIVIQQPLHSPQPDLVLLSLLAAFIMTSFASLMAMSATHTKESQRVVEDALQERRRKEAQQKKQQEEREAKEKEQKRKLLIRRFEDQKREQERLQRLEVERQAQQLALQRREEEQRDALRYGPKKAAKLAGKPPSGSRDSPNWPSSSSSNRDAVRKLRAPDDDDDGPSGLALTREELRERKHQAGLQKSFKTGKRSTTTGGHSRRGNKFAGGVLNIKASGSSADLSAGQSVKERLTSLPMTLKVLGGGKKDTRSELEILSDSKKKRSGQVLEGDEARNFDGYFTLTKKEKARLKQAQTVASATTSGTDSSGSSELRHLIMIFFVGIGSGEGSPSTSLRESSSSKPPPATSVTSKQSHATSAHPRGTSKQVLSSTPSTSKATIPKTSQTNSTTPRATSTAHNRPKRHRSPSLSESPPPKKRHIDSNISSTIWKMFGKDRQQYTSQNVFSDDEDMEADATVLEREEAYRSDIPSFFLFGCAYLPFLI